MNYAKKIYVLVGHQACQKPFGKQAVIVMEGESEIQFAKKIRKNFTTFVRGIRFNPSELFWAIYDNITDKEPREYSQNFTGKVLDIVPEQ